jgi:hypothetical protein
MKNCKTHPELPLSDEQKDSCKKCGHISSNFWCCLYGFWIDGKENKSTQRSSFENDYEQLKQRYDGLPKSSSQTRLDIVDLQTYINRRTVCDKCMDKSKCNIRPCMRHEKLIQLAASCSLNKW